MYQNKSTYRNDSILGRSFFKTFVVGLIWIDYAHCFVHVVQKTNTFSIISITYDIIELVAIREHIATVYYTTELNKTKSNEFSFDELVEFNF